MKKDSAPNPELRKIALDFYTGPFHFDDLGGYIWAKGNGNTGNQMFADLDAAKERCARIRGWGALQYLKEVDCEALQDEIGVMFAEAITEYWDRKKNGITLTLETVTEDKGESFNRLQDWVYTQGGVDAKCHVVSRVKRGLKIAAAQNQCDYFMQITLPAHGICAYMKEGDSVTVENGRVFLDIKPEVLNTYEHLPEGVTFTLPGKDVECPAVEAFQEWIASRYLPGTRLDSMDSVSGERSWRLVLVTASTDGIDTTLREGDKITVREGRVYLN